MAKSEPEAVGLGTYPLQSTGNRSVCEIQKMGGGGGSDALIEKTAPRRQTDGSGQGQGCYGCKGKPQNKKRSVQLGLVHF